jgi:hypothetical protein
VLYANPGGGDLGGDYKGNYGINWGSFRWSNQTAPLPNGYPDMPGVGGPGPFELDVDGKGIAIEARYLIDGMTNTYFALEMLQAPSGTTAEDLDRRARLWTPAASTHQISTLLIPNAQRCTALSAAPNETTGCGGDVGTCMDRPDIGQPCQRLSPEGTGVQITLGARSNHPGGVQVAMCDASGRYIADGIDLRAWRSMSSRAGEEVVSEN